MRRTAGKAKKENSTVIAITFKKTERKYFDSDTVCILSNLTKIKDSERKDIYDVIAEGLKKAKEKEKDFTNESLQEFIDVDKFNERPSVRRLVQFVRQERPGFETRINPVDLTRFVPVYPKYSNKRIIAQSGAFLLFGIIKEITEGAKKRVFPKLEINQIEINRNKRKSILEQLDISGINKRSLFPEIEHASTYISKKFEFETPE